ncbi:hypothetical protein [Burkholderia sp. Se-20373]|uniref:hypothetical protein n=1 Tax=Burkholderia sp. Se-20373 TaxID=2703898 RepID=UPI001F119A9A|nr:hypothetical protein [Burkholderia sp. Se-20373]
MKTTDKSRADALTRESIDAIARKYAGSYFSGMLFQDADSFARFSDDIIATASPVEQHEAAPADGLTAQQALAAIETFEIVGENNDSREPNDDDRFIITEFIAHAFGGFPVEQPSTDARQAWEYSFIHSSATGRGDTKIGPCLTYDRSTAFGVGCIEQREVFVSASRTVAQPEPQAADERAAFAEWWKSIAPSNFDYTSALAGYLARASSPNAAGAQIGWAWISPTGHVSRFSVEFDGKHDQLSPGWQVRPVAFCDETNAAGAEGVKPCETCGGRGEVGGFVVTGFGEGGYDAVPCPDCAAPSQAAEPVAWCVPNKKSGKPEWGKDWMFSPIQQQKAVMPLYAAPPPPASASGIIEAIATQWDGCMFEGIGHDINIGNAIRDAWKRLAGSAAPASAPVGLTATHFVAKYGNGTIEYSTCVDGFDLDWAETRGGVEIVGLVEFERALLAAHPGQREPRAEVTALIAAAEQVVRADRACALDDSDINALAAAIDAARAGDGR